MRPLTFFAEGEKHDHNGAAKHNGDGNGEFHVVHGDGVFLEELWVVFQLLFKKRLASDPPGVVEDVSPGEWVVAVGVRREQVVVLDESTRTEDKGESSKDEGGQESENAQSAHVQVCRTTFALARSRPVPSRSAWDPLLIKFSSSRLRFATIAPLILNICVTNAAYSSSLSVGIYAKCET